MATDNSLTTTLEERAREARLLGLEYTTIPLEAVDPLQKALFLVKDLSKCNGDKRQWGMITRAQQLIRGVNGFTL